MNKSVISQLERHEVYKNSTEKMTNSEHLDILAQNFLHLNRCLINQGVSLKTLKSMCNSKKDSSLPSTKKIFFIILIPIILIKLFSLDSAIPILFESRCLLNNNYLVWEFSRPVSDCSYCIGVDQVVTLQNLTRESFKKFAYSSRPIIAKGAATDWPAARVFSLDFFKKLYDSIPGAYESSVEECQFLHFHSNFKTLEQVLTMDRKRALNLQGEESWYVGWKNCHPQVLETMRAFYQPPDFLPEDAEIPPTNYVFLGYDQGAHMHLDYIPRLMWQAQLRGSKTWLVAPTPECNHLCKPFSFFVDENDIVLLDTRIWYHSTYVNNRKMSMTVTSEYG